MLHIVVRIYPQTLMTKTFFLWKLTGKIICRHGKQKLRKRNYTTCTFNLDSYSCLVKLRTLFPRASCLLYQNLFQWLWMHYMNVISFIHHFPGLLRTSKMTSSQLACWLSWQSTAPVSQRSWVQLLNKPQLFSFFVFTTASVVCPWLRKSLSSLKFVSLQIIWHRT